MNAIVRAERSRAEMLDSRRYHEASIRDTRARFRAYMGLVRRALAEVRRIRRRFGVSMPEQWHAFDIVCWIEDALWWRSMARRELAALRTLRGRP